MFALLLLIIGILSRFIPHIPNFTPVMAIALFSGVHINKRYALVLPLFLMMVTDYFLGINLTTFFVWGSILLISCLGLWLREHNHPMARWSISLLSSILFFLVTNFGVWLVSGLYPHSVEGLSRCFILAIPFFRNELFSTLIYTFSFFKIYELISFHIRKTRFASVLL